MEACHRPTWFSVCSTGLFLRGPIAARAVRLASLCFSWASSICCNWKGGRQRTSESVVHEELHSYSHILFLNSHFKSQGEYFGHFLYNAMLCILPIHTRNAKKLLHNYRSIQDKGNPCSRIKESERSFTGLMVYWLVWFHQSQMFPLSSIQRAKGFFSTALTRRLTPK